MCTPLALRRRSTRLAVIHGDAVNPRNDGGCSNSFAAVIQLQQPLQSVVMAVAEEEVAKEVRAAAEGRSDSDINQVALS